jgi:hypothetical protein
LKSSVAALFAELSDYPRFTKQACPPMIDCPPTVVEDHCAEGEGERRKEKIKERGEERRRRRRGERERGNGEKGERGN